MIKKYLYLLLIFCFTLTCTQAAVDNTVTKDTKTEKLIKDSLQVTEKTTKTIEKKLDNTKNKIKTNMKELNAEIEAAKKEMDFQADSLQDLYNQAEELKKTEQGAIFDENDMEVIGKTFWTRKPIHPDAKYGYVGRLPQIAGQFDYKKTKDAYKSLIPTNPDATKKDLIPAPRDNKAYVDIVIKKGGSSQYVNDVNDVIVILQKIIVNIENNVDVQKFNAQVSNLLDNIFYIQDKYQNKPEANYISYYKMLELANSARDAAVLRTEARAYAKYLAYSGEGAKYSPPKIRAVMDKLLKEINETLIILKAVN